MKRSIYFLLSVLFIACADEPKIVDKSDSVKGMVGPEQMTLQTDSGKLVVTMKDGLKNGQATLYFDNGAVKAKGLFVNDLPAGAWLHYDESGVLTRAEHLSNGKVLHDLDKNDFDFITYNSTGLGIHFSIPKQWKEIKSPNPSLLLSFEKPLPDSVAKFHPNINIVKAKLQPHDNLQSLATMQIQLLHEQFDRVEIVSEENLVIDSCQAFRRFGMYYDGLEKVGFMNAIIISGGEAYFFSCAAQNNEDAEFLKYEGTFDLIFSSFKRN